ncbi:MAG TPA: potassium channel protein [Candidatus Aminicenantes bacterium]|nr:potassium channel protein [Candidatus Aminicenantes bacterium]
MWKPIVLIFLVIIIGTLGYHFIEHMPFLDSLYMTIITITTVGFREVKEPLSSGGQIFTIFIILGGVGTAIFALTKIGEAIYVGGFRQYLRRKRMEKEIKNLKDHYIICGHGRMGQIVRERLEEENLPFVIIEKNVNQIKDFQSKNHCLAIIGDATQEEILLKARIKKARALAALLPSDADNLYLSFTAKLLNPSLFVLSKALDEKGEKKILQIGANRVVNPYKLSGLKIAQGLIRPTLVDFMDLIIRRRELSLYMDEFVVSKKAKIKDKSIVECDLRKKANVIVVAIKKPGEDIVFNPLPETKIESGDTLLVMGDTQSIDLFQVNYLSPEKG